MKKSWIIILDWILRHLIYFNTNFAFYYKYQKEIHNTYIEPTTELIGDPYGEYHYEVVWSKPPKWYRGWLYKVENHLAQIIYPYLFKNKKYLAR